MKKIVVAVDFSPATKAVVAEGVSLARVCRGRIILIHIVAPPAPIISHGLYTFDPSEVIAASEKFGQQMLARWRNRLRLRGIDVRTAQAVGFPTNEIVSLARKVGADYILMGSHGHTAFHDLLIGSTASGVLKKAPCPIVIVPVQKKKRAARS